MLYNVEPVDVSCVVGFLYSNGIDSDTVHAAADNIICSRRNFGTTITDSENRKTIIIIGASTSAEQFADTWQHEIFHSTIHLSDSLDIDLRSERSAYIAGEIAKITSVVASNYMCRKCTCQ